MTTTTNEITFQEAQDEYFADIEDMIDAEIEQEVSGHAAHVKEQLAAYHRYCELADAGSLCRCCTYRPMATEGSLYYGQGVCDSCGDNANSIYQDFLKGR